jgi:hypothetical protein
VRNKTNSKRKSKTLKESFTFGKQRGKKERVSKNPAAQWKASIQKYLTE